MMGQIANIRTATDDRTTVTNNRLDACEKALKECTKTIESLTLNKNEAYENLKLAN